jgi:hypothetical protein
MQKSPDVALCLSDYQVATASHYAVCNCVANKGHNNAHDR